MEAVQRTMVMVGAKEGRDPVNGNHNETREGMGKVQKE